MTWAVILPIILFSLFKIAITSLPTGAIEWIFSKFGVHSKLNDADVTVTINGITLEGEDKAEIIKAFNEATFLEKQYVWPGTEQSYLNPEDSGTPLTILTKRGKMDVKILLFRYPDHVDVVKQYKKKVVAYSLLANDLQKQSISAAL